MPSKAQKTPVKPKAKAGAGQPVDTTPKPGTEAFKVRVLHPVACGVCASVREEIGEYKYEFEVAHADQLEGLD